MKSYHYLVTQVSQQILLVNCRMAVLCDVKHPKLIPESAEDALLQAKWLSCSLPTKVVKYE